MLTGSCACGSIRYTSNTKPSLLVNCHCTTCRKQAGPAYQTFAVFAAGVIDWQVQPTEWRSSDFATRSFCARCGSTLCMVLDQYPETVAIVAGTLDDPGPGQIPSPCVHCFLQEKVSWFEIPEDGTMRYDGPRTR